MSKRIFTKVFSGEVSAVGPLVVDEGALAAWLIQYESIEVIGALGCIQLDAPSNNDGTSFAIIELSQVGVFGLDAAILAVSAAEHWNTAPAGISQAGGNVAVAFPSGSAIPVKEEGYLYINSRVVGKSAGVSVYNWEVIVYYTKKTGR